MPNSTLMRGDKIPSRSPRLTRLQRFITSEGEEAAEFL